MGTIVIVNAILSQSDKVYIKIGLPMFRRWFPSHLHPHQTVNEKNRWYFIQHLSKYSKVVSDHGDVCILYDFINGSLQNLHPFF